MKGDQHQNVNGKSGRSERVLARGLCGPRQQRLSFLPDAAPEFARWLGSGEGGALVRREKGAYIQWEEDIPPGNFIRTFCIKGLITLLHCLDCFRLER